MFARSLWTAQASRLVPRLVGTAVILAVALALLGAPATSRADTAPVNGEPATVSADPLPTTQINGVAWTQLVLGDVVYVGGSFTSARPAGAPRGDREQPRANLLAYDLNTGVLLDSWAPTTNGDVDALAASPDGTTIYAGGLFTTVNGRTARRLVALDATTGRLDPTWLPNPDARVRAIAATASTVYFGGSFSAIGPSSARVARQKIAAVSATDASVRPYAPQIVETSARVNALAVSPDERQVLLGGSFTSLNGSSRPGYGLASTDADTGGSLPWAANDVVRDAGDDAGITSLTSQGDTVLATGYVWGPEDGNFESVAKMSWAGGDIEWLGGCFGDSYDAFGVGSVVYVVGHQHSCETAPDGFADALPQTWFRATAFTQNATGTLTRDVTRGPRIPGYTLLEGKPSPSLLHWYPDVKRGVVTGQNQGAWAVTGAQGYLLLAGEFPGVNRSSGQEGLVRFAAPPRAPDQAGFGYGVLDSTPVAQGLARGEVVVSWPTNFDRDSERLTYRLYRAGRSAPLTTRVVDTVPHHRPLEAYLDAGLAPGESVRYRVQVSDPVGNTARSGWATATVPRAGNASALTREMVGDAPTSMWRFKPAEDDLVRDQMGRLPLRTYGSALVGLTGMNSGSGALELPGAAGSGAHSAASYQATSELTSEAWFRTTSTQGGAVLGFGSAATGASIRSDATIYLGSDGRARGGVFVIDHYESLGTGPRVNDGAWHHAAVTMDPLDGVAFYVDGTLVGRSDSPRQLRRISGYWRLGGDSLAGYPDRPASDYLAGSIDAVAIYPKALSAEQIRSRVTVSAPSVALPQDAYGRAVMADGPAFWWRLGEVSGQTAADASLQDVTGTYATADRTPAGSAIKLPGDASSRFDGASDSVAQARPGAASGQFAGEAWFATRTRDGGPLLSYGPDASGPAERLVYLTERGRLSFAVRTEAGWRVIRSRVSSNDGAWHHVVAQVGSSTPRGMRLYLDGSLVAVDRSVGAQAPSRGTWRVASAPVLDPEWSATRDHLAARVDEVAAYDRPLTTARVRAHYLLGGGDRNATPIARFGYRGSGPRVSFNGRASQDRDGRIIGYFWSFGDQKTSRRARVTHRFARPGVYRVSLRVTDDRGALSPERVKQVRVRRR